MTDIEDAYAQWRDQHDQEPTLKEAFEAGARVQPPTREQITTAVRPVIGRWYDTGGNLQEQLADAVLALFQQPTPSAEPKPSLCARLQPHETHATSFRVWAKDGYYDVPGRCPGVPAELVSIADMAPGTTFRGHLSSSPTQAPLLLVTVGRMTVCKVRSGEIYSALDVDSSTIRDVTPPPA